MKKKIISLLVLSIILTSFSGLVFAESLEYEGYKKLYYDKLLEFREDEELLDGARPVGKDAALVSHFNGEIPALFTISYYKGKSDNGIYNYRYRVYIAEEGRLRPVRLNQNIVDNEADYNFYTVNVAGDLDNILKSQYHLAREKDTDTKYLLLYSKSIDDPMFDRDDEYYDPWYTEDTVQETYILENFLKDRDKNISPDYRMLDKQTNKRKESRYYYQDTREIDRNPEITGKKYASLVREFKENHTTRLLGPGDLNQDHIRQILTEDRDINIVVDKKLINLNTPAIIKNNRTLLPVRSIFEAMGMEVEWNPKSQLVTGRKDKRKIEIKIGSNIALVDGKKEKLDSPAIIENGRTLVPVRFIAESMDREVDWDRVNRTVYIK